MPTQDPKKSKATDKKPVQGGKVDKADLSDEELKEVSGGMRVSDPLASTDPCITSFGG